MNNIKPAEKEVQFSIEKAIDLVRQVRNDLVKDFFIDSNLDSYFKNQYNKELSAVKREFLKRDLKELLIAPVDLIHYGGLIKEIKELNTASLASGNQELFYQELGAIFMKYNY